MSASSARPGVSVPAALLEAYRAAGSSVPPLSALLARAMRTALEEVGVPVPAPEQPSAKTAKATAARWARAGRAQKTP